MTTDRFYVESKLKYDWDSDHILFYRAFAKATGGRITTNRDGSLVKCHIDHKDTFDKSHDKIAKHFGFQSFSTRIPIEITFDVLDQNLETQRTRADLYCHINNIKYQDENNGTHNSYLHIHMYHVLQPQELKKYLETGDPDVESELKKYIDVICSNSTRQFQNTMKQKYQEYLNLKRFEKLLDIQITDPQDPLIQDLIELEIDSGWSSKHFEKVIKRIFANRDSYLACKTKP